MESLLHRLLPSWYVQHAPFMPRCVVPGITGSGDPTEFLAGDGLYRKPSGGGGDTFIKAYRTTDGAPVNNSTVLVADDVLKFAIGANEVWSWKCWLPYQDDGSRDGISFAFSGPASPVFVKYGCADFLMSNVLREHCLAIAFGDQIFTNPLGGPAANNLYTLSIDGTISNGLTPGTVQLEIAQSFASGSPALGVTLLAGAHLIAHKLSA